MSVLEHLALVLPKVKTPTQLVGLVVLVVGVLITRATAPDAVLAQVSVGAIGVVILIFAQFFAALEKYPQRQRAALTLRLSIVFTCLVGFLIVAAIGFTSLQSKTPPAPADQVSIGFGDTQFKNLIPAIEMRFNVTIALSARCDASVTDAPLRGGTITKSTVHELLMALRENARSDLEYTVKESGSRYEIVCG